ncbi:MAG: methylenetetrahydrofolate reductase C-terminal domain-containing protein [Kiritimatiellaeota bacterium]|nr:methylenetetrahydrofolate reductase C-terminal domain-containing protein [Kiritimatiellota bacterium]
MTLLQSLKDGFFCLTVECTPHSAAEVRQIAALAKALPELNKKYAAQRIAFPTVTLTQNPGGNLSYDAHAAIAILRQADFPAEIEILPHVTGKDMNADALTTLLQAFVEGGIGTILALTGDVPTGRGVFELDSLGLLQLVNHVNVEQLKKAKDFTAFSAMPQLAAGAAVSPFKYTPGSLAMQLIKAAKKVREGAAFLVCQAGWDADRSEQLIAELAAEKVPLFGNAVVINEVAARFMQKLPGCVITDAFLQRLHSENEDDALTRAAQQVAMFRALGYAGTDLGKPGDFRSPAELEKIVDRALAISDWRAFHDNLTFAPPAGAPPKVSKSAGFSWTVHGAVFEEDGALHGVTKALLRPFNNSAQHEGALYRMFKGLEDFGKGVAYQCEHCGDCFLMENQYVCTLGQCEKGVGNVPCGDADPSGRCGNNPDRVCVGEKIYYRALHRKALDEFKRITVPRRIPSLRSTSSLLNKFFDRDHSAHKNPLAGSGLIQIAELIHASLPFAGAAMKFVLEQGADGFAHHNRGRAAIEELIREQSAAGGDYIDINVDALGAPNPPDFMRQMVRLVHAHSDGTPPCVDSSNPAVLEAGLDEWLSLGKDLRPPLVNSVTFSETERYDKVLARRKERVFGVVCLLVGKEGPLKRSSSAAPPLAFAPTTCSSTPLRSASAPMASWMVKATSRVRIRATASSPSSRSAATRR